ncbi:MAG: ATP-binding cassette domain-containing protein [Daejeonella sp.]
MIHTLEADGIDLSFSGRKILSDIYIKCETGKITGLLGRNGQGKSCLMQVIYGSLSVKSKSVRVDGSYIPDAYKRSDLLVYMPQFNFVPGALKLERIFRDLEVEFSAFTRQFPIYNQFFQSSISSLSGGQRRLVELYLIVMTKSHFAMLDEPFSHLSPIQIDQMKELIIDEKRNKGFLVTDHMYRHITEISDNIYVLVNGKVHLTSSLEDIENLGYAYLSK